MRIDPAMPTRFHTSLAVGVAVLSIACESATGKLVLVEQWRTPVATQSIPWGVVDCGAAIAVWSGEADTLQLVDRGTHQVVSRLALGWSPIAVGCDS